jgi:hypothetical protein
MSWFTRGCCESVGCSRCDNPPTEWVLDFGAGGLINAAGDNCTDYSGEITVGPAEANFMPAICQGHCTTYYACCFWDGPIAAPTCSEGCQPGGGCGRPSLALVGAPGLIVFRYILTIYLTCGDGETTQKFVSNYSSPLTRNCLDLLDPVTGKMALYYASVSHTGVCAPCAGWIPGPVYAWPAP